MAIKVLVMLLFLVEVGALVSVSGALKAVSGGLTTVSWAFKAVLGALVSVSGALKAVSGALDAVLWAFEAVLVALRAVSGLIVLKCSLLLAGTLWLTPCAGRDCWALLLGGSPCWAALGPFSGTWSARWSCPCSCGSTGGGAALFPSSVTCPACWCWVSVKHEYRHFYKSWLIWITVRGKSHGYSLNTIFFTIIRKDTSQHNPSLYITRTIPWCVCIYPCLSHNCPPARATTDTYLSQQGW